ncbi:MAG TPA: LysR family transcriptional regulator [Rhodocyclaceae bacterium]|nr:LysR family transcriptional regulator [Rhodocyclaceae bacterium]
MADRRLQVFHAVAIERNFTRAAESLFMSQPAVTFQIRQLEERYQVRLFERTPGNVTLTAAGELMFHYAEKIQALNDELERRLGDMTGEMRGILAIGASTSLAESVLPGILAEFNATYPQVRPRLIVGNAENIVGQVVSRTLEVALVGGRVDHVEVECIICSEDTLDAYCAPDYPLAKVKAVSAKHLREYEYITREPGSGSRAAAEAWFSANGVKAEQLKTLMELGSPEALKQLVRGGAGFTIAPHLIFADDVECSRLVRIPLKPALTRPLTLIYPKDRFRSRLVSTFIDFVRQQLKEFVF